MKKPLYLIIIFLLMACEGPTGPRGPSGTAGVANIQSFEFEWTEDDVVYDEDDINLAYVTFSLEELTESIVTNGAVQAYYYNDFVTSSLWQALPYTRGIDDNGDQVIDVLIEFTYGFAAGEVSVIFYNSTGSGLISGDVLAGKVRFVLIPPG
ncbi:hypothetical protein NC796_22590 [Aliifodinibius sp. S!AR15-10]|uniref:hypothetical protein n=1 Tax=Aliifodinibius sp. S!AR15-10 TaxID=2950437 RepID=UPI0028544FF3|nr:hypothetical protein [Aliifodinibius sp. S!AR15-10]MDR8393960.1 hypothetical protein [Aliifodinibius sp. S!AR15-10]